MTIEFRECTACAAKPGSPTLCAACLHNRATINRLLAALRAAIDGWERSLRTSEDRGWHLDHQQEIDALRKKFDA